MVRVRPYKIVEKPNSSQNKQHFVDFGEKKLPFQRKRPGEQPDSPRASICLDGETCGKRREEGGKERERGGGERRERPGTVV